MAPEINVIDTIHLSELVCVRGVFEDGNILHPKFGANAINFQKIRRDFNFNWCILHCIH